jgi:hypothetical protein
MRVCCKGMCVVRESEYERLRRQRMSVGIVRASDHKERDVRHC